MAVKSIKLVLDTSAYSGFNRGDEQLREFFQPDIQILIPLIVISELRASFSLGSKAKENETLLQKFLDSPNINTITMLLPRKTCYASPFFAV